MKVLVCISNVPDTTTKITFTNDNTEFNTSGVQFIINPYDELALSKAVDLCEGGKGTVTVINVGEVSTEPIIRKALAIGADNAVRINAAPLHADFVAAQIAQYAKDKNFDLILCGRESIDYNGAQVPAMIAEHLAIPSISIIKKLSYNDGQSIVEREIEGGKEVIEVSGAFVASCAEGVAEMKIANMRGIMAARTKPLEVVEASAAAHVNCKIVNYETPPARSAVKLLEASQVKELVNLLHSEAKVI